MPNIRLCPLCDFPMYRAKYDKKSEHGKMQQHEVDLCSGCGPYWAICNIGNLTERVPRWVALLEGDNQTRYRGTPEYRNFLTHLRHLMAVDRLDRFLNDSKALNWFVHPAIITEAMLNEALSQKIYLNLADQLDNAIILFAEYEQRHAPFPDKISLSADRIPPTDDLEVAASNIQLLVHEPSLFDLRYIGVEFDSSLVVHPQNEPSDIQITGQARDSYRVRADANNKLRPIIEEMVNQKLIISPEKLNHSRRTSHQSPQLTVAGWKLYKELKNKTEHSNIAFMAMGFTSTNLWAYNNIFRPAAKACGFELQTVNEDPNFGSIRADIELKIKRAPFVIVDLSGGNNGAYWEAGFAFGLGKEVIYTCDTKAWKTKRRTKGRHFDVIGDQTIKWSWSEKSDESNHQINVEAFKTLISSIRNSVSGAKMSPSPIEDEVADILKNKQLIYKP